MATPPQPIRDDDVKWLALLIRQAALMLAKGIERRYNLGEYKEDSRDQDLRDVRSRQTA